MIAVDVVLRLLALVLVLAGCKEDSTVPTVLTDGRILEQVSPIGCIYPDEVYYFNQSETTSYFTDTRDMEEFWDLRYHIPDVTSECTKFSATIDLSFPHTEVFFGGPQSTLIYRMEDVYPWRDGNNLAIQVFMDEPLFNGIGGGNIAINFFIRNSVTGERLNYVISLYTLGVAWSNESIDILYDPSTDTSFISTIIDSSTRYTTISQHSATTNTEGADNFYRVNITKEQLPVGSPEDWYLPFVGIQYELEESLGESYVSSGFRDFDVFITDEPI